MHGKNLIVGRRKLEQGYAIHSIFKTIQGEGPWAGWPALFVRFAECNLRCYFCDTNFDTTVILSLQELVATICASQAKRVVLTGGEPMLQALPELLMANTQAIFQIETAGTVWPEGMEDVPYDKAPVIVCSPKTPAVHPRIEERVVFWKYIIRAGELGDDGLPNKSTQIVGQAARIFRSERKYSVIYVQPCDEDDPTANAANLQAAVTSSMVHGYRLSLQLHKIAGLP
jgi:organic radical activating enzyme